MGIFSLNLGPLIVHGRWLRVTQLGFFIAFGSLYGCLIVIIIDVKSYVILHFLTVVVVGIMCVLLFEKKKGNLLFQKKINS